MAKILFADDEKDFNESVIQLLEILGHSVITAEDGVAAVAKFKEEKPDIVFLDINMPKLNGFEAYTKIIKYNNNAKVILLSGFYLNNKQIENFKDIGGVDVIQKPVSQEQLSEIINKHT